MAEESGRTESTVDKKAVKEALSELLQEMPIFRSLSVGMSSHPASAVPGPSTEPEGVKAGGKSSKRNPGARGFGGVRRGG